MSKHLLIGPFFITGNLNSDRYIQLLNDEFIHELRKRRLGSIRFQQNGAPAHTALQTRCFLTKCFTNGGLVNSVQHHGRPGALT